MKKIFQLFTLLVISSVLFACGGSGGSSNTTTDTSGSSAVTSLKVTDNTLGTGVGAVAGNTLTVNYTGWLYNVSAPNYEGIQFDSSLATGRTPFTFVLGGNVISGWNQGLVGMQVGGTRTLIIPSSLGYGAYGQGQIPANAALVFTVTLLSIS